MSDRPHPSNLLDYRVGANLARGRSPLTLHQRLSLQILENRGQITIATDDSHDFNAAVDGAIEDDGNCSGVDERVRVSSVALQVS